MVEAGNVVAGRGRNLLDCMSVVVNGKELGPPDQILHVVVSVEVLAAVAHILVSLLAVVEAAVEAVADSIARVVFVLAQCS